MLTCPMYFQWLHRLAHLDISLNPFLCRLPAILPFVLQNMRNLNELSLHGCGIRELPVGMFTNTTQLTTTVLSGNAIKSWNPDVFAPLRNLSLLTLARNQIASVNVASFSQLTSLRRLDLSRNPFACNCDLMWFLEYVQNNNIFVLNIGSASSYTCASPESLHGVPLLRAELSPEDCVSHTDLVVTLSTAAPLPCRRLCLLWCTEAAGTSVTTSSLFALDAAATSNWLTATTPTMRSSLTAATTEPGSSDVYCHNSRQKVATGCASISETGLPVERSARTSKSTEYRSESQGDHRSLEQLRSKSLVPGGISDG